MNIKPNNYLSIEQMTGKLLNQNMVQPKKEIQEASFADVLQRQQITDSLKFSKHANERLATRNITLSESQMNRLADATEKAKEKGIKESLVMLDDMAFIVNVKNNTVVTAVNDTSSAVFTNIDGAVII